MRCPDCAHEFFAAFSCDPEFGENSALYASFGYVHKTDRKSGLTRIVTLPAQLAQPDAEPTVVLKAA